MWFAMGACANVMVVGFGACDSGRQGAVYYHRDKAFDKFAGFHSLDVEMQWLRDLRRAGIIEMIELCN